MSQSKADLMKAIMRHPSTAKMFRDAINSPIGSTSRAKAQKVFKSMDRLSATQQDGSGGPGMQMEQYEESAPDSSNQTSQGMIIFHKLPEMDINFDGAPRKAKASHVADGSGGPGGVCDGAGGIGDWFSSALTDFGNAVGGAANAVGSFINGGATPTTYAAASTPAPAYNSQSSQSGLTPGQYSTPPSSTPYLGPYAPGVTPINSPPVDRYTPPTPAPVVHGGIIPAATAVGNDVAKATYGGLAGLGMLTAGAAQFVGQNALSGAETALGGYVYNPKTGQNVPALGGTPLISWGNTVGGSAMADAINKYAPSWVSPSGVSSAPAYAAGNSTNQPQPQAQAPNQPQPQTGISSQYPGLSGGPSMSSTGGSTSSGASSGATSGSGSAAKNVSQMLGVDPNTSLSQLLSSGGIDAIRNAIIKNEGGSPSGVINNPGNVKFIGAPGQTDSGVKAADGGTFASYATADAGNQAINDLITRAASGQSSVYGSNPTLASFMGTYTNTGSGSSTTGSSTGAPGSASVASAVDQHMGPGMFALNQMLNPKDPITGGMNEAAIEAANKKTVWSDYNIDGQQKHILDLQNAASALPQDLTDYIRNQDQYLNQTDQMINDYIAKNAGVAMNNETRQAYVAHLNYLYTLRGAQNQRYINYMGSAVAMNKSDLEQATNTYNSQLKMATEELTSKNAITADMFKAYSTALTDMYTATQDAPTRALQLQYLQSQIYQNYATQASDAAKLQAQNSYLTVYPKLKNQIYDSNEFAMNIDLVQKLQSLAVSNPEIDSGTILTVYSNTVDNVLNAPSGGSGNPTKDGNGQPINKKKTATEAFTNYAKLAGVGVQENNTALITNAIGYGDRVATTLGSILGGEWTSDADKIKTLISSLSKKGWFGGSSTPSRTAFVSDATNQGLDPEMANALYDEFANYMSTDKAKADDFVNGMLNNMTSQTNRAPYSDQQLLSHLGSITALSIFSQSLSQNGLKLNPDGSVTVSQSGSTLQT